MFEFDGLERSEDIDIAHCKAGNPTLDGQALLTELGVNIGIDGGAEYEFAMEYEGNEGDVAMEFEVMLPMVILLLLLTLFMSKEGRFSIGTGTEPEDLLDKTDPIDGEGE